MDRTSRTFVAALAAFIAVLVAGTALAAGAGSSPAVVKVGSTGLGRVLVDAKGKTLYLWAHDRTAKSTCYGDCAEYWPPLITNGKPSAIGGANAKLVGTTRRTDGRIQVTYNGHPLYDFVQDTKPGLAKGEGLTGFGGRWDPVSAAGRAVQAPPAPTTPVAATIVSPGAGDSAGVGGTFSVNVSLQARTAAANSLLSGFSSAYNDPNAPSFHPGPNSAAPGLVVLLSTTPTVDGTPLQGPNTNLAGVFQINDITQAKGLKHTYNSWLVTVPGFFGKATQATLTVYAVTGTAPAVVTGAEKAISNVARETFSIAG